MEEKLEYISQHVAERNFPKHSTLWSQATLLLFVSSGEPVWWFCFKQNKQGKMAWNGINDSVYLQWFPTWFFCPAASSHWPDTPGHCPPQQTESSPVQQSPPLHHESGRNVLLWARPRHHGCLRPKHTILTLILSLIFLSSASSSNSFWGYTSMPLARNSSLICKRRFKHHPLTKLNPPQFKKDPLSDLQFQV